ncbi:MAG: transcriptional repressor LexA [Anaerolineales bacterium]|nr:transcriptional repressor LexA [Anaerolineales bacterium]
MVRTRRGLTERHHNILNYLDRRLNEYGYPPSIREIGEATGISSTSVVTYYLKQLSELGLIERDPKFSRAVRLTKEPELSVSQRVAEAVHNVVAVADELLSIPIVGRIFASAPVPVPSSDFNYYDVESSINIARSLLPRREKGTELFALEVQGDSMIDAMVNDGDIVIMKHAEQANNGEMVAVWLEDKDETTLKYFFREKGRIRLQPANPTLQPIYVNNPKAVKIQGKVVVVIRKVESTAA